MPLQRIFLAGWSFFTLWIGADAYGVQATAIGMVTERWNVVGVISEESPERPLSGVVVLRHKASKEIHTLTVGDPLPGDPSLSIVSTRPGRVVVSDGQKEATLERVEGDPAVEEAPERAEDDPLGKKTLVGGSSLDGTTSFPTWTGGPREPGMIPKGIFERPVSSLTDEAFRFPYFKADRSLRSASEGGGAPDTTDPYQGLESFSQAFEKSITDREDGTDFDESGRDEMGPLPSPWWSGEEWDLSDATP